MSQTKSPTEGARYVAYYRVSTARQGRSGLGIEAQQKAVSDYLKGEKPLYEFTEVECGAFKDRPRLADALAACRIHRAVLILAKLDRLARNVAFVSNLMEAGVEFVAVDFPAANRLTIHILAAVAEHEAQTISERTRAALAVAKRRGVQLGGFRGRAGTCTACQHARKARTMRARRRATDLKDLIDHERQQGNVTLRALASALNIRGVTAPRGGTWSAAQIRRLLIQTEAFRNRHSA
jgi:DNA invertase Pin-like site-specific DNA recombinase